MIALHEQLLAFLDQVPADVLHQRTHIGSTTITRYRQRMHLGVRRRKQQLGAAAASDALRTRIPL